MIWEGNGNEEEHSKEHEEMPQERHKNESIEFHSLNEPQVEGSKK